MDRSKIIDVLADEIERDSCGRMCLDDALVVAENMVEKAFPPLPPVVQALVAAMAAHPSQRVGQIIFNAVVGRNDVAAEDEGGVIFNVPDSGLVNALLFAAAPVLADNPR